MVVDIKRCIEEKIVIWCTTREQAQQIYVDYHKYFKKTPMHKKWTVSKVGQEFEIWFDRDMSPSWQDGYNRKYFIDTYDASKCLDYEEVLLSKVYELW